MLRIISDLIVCLPFDSFIRRFSAECIFVRQSICCASISDLYSINVSHCPFQPINVSLFLFLAQICVALRIDQRLRCSTVGGAIEAGHE